ncbi:MAG: hypothetical protein R2788_20470 [Saprospiraceae bacterium]
MVGAVQFLHFQNRGNANILSLKKAHPSVSGFGLNKSSTSFFGNIDGSANASLIPVSKRVGREGRRCCSKILILPQQRTTIAMRHIHKRHNWRLFVIQNIELAMVNAHAMQRKTMLANGDRIAKIDVHISALAVQYFFNKAACIAMTAIYAPPMSAI